MSLYSVKMRASKKIEQKDLHVSGAEKIITAADIDTCTNLLIKRALKHDRGSADFINVKIQSVKDDEIIKLKALTISQKDTKDKQEAYAEIQKELNKIGIFDTDKIFEKLKQTSNMRGAMLLDINTFERLEPDLERGIRATFMDSEKFEITSNKNHFQEALILATKVANAPNIVGEICVSDDINYTTGYFASKQAGYIRITNIKELGDSFGGRIFLYNGKTSQDLKNTINFIEKQPVLVTDIEKATTTQDKYLYIKAAVENLKEKNLYREQSSITKSENSMVEIDNKKYKMFASNNYLGLSNNKKIKNFAVKMLKKYGSGTGGSRLINGNLDLHEKLEKKIAQFKNSEAAIVFNSGYCANVAVLAAMFTDGDVIFSDELNHASIIDGCKLSKAKTVVYKHNDMEDLEEKINKFSFNRGVIVSDAVFSMDGDIANLPEILKLAKKYNLFTYLDEAHSTGVLGETGKGICEHFNLTEHPDILMGTLSKAIGAEGGYVCGNSILIDYLRNTARSYIFSTSLSAAPIAAAYKSFEILEKDNSLVKKLHENVDYFNSCLKDYGINAHSQTPIFSIIIGDEEKTLNIAKTLNEQKFFIKAIRYPTVAKGEARLRVTLSATTQKKDMKELAKILSKTL